MIIDFVVKNFRSFRDEVSFSMEADASNSRIDNLFKIGKDNQQVRLLKSAVIYGANGSGKSNFIKALLALQELVVNSSLRKVNTPIKEYDPYALDINTKSAPTHFSLIFILNDIKYQYEITFDAHCILSETLDFYPLGQRANLFRRYYNKDNKSYTEVSLGKKLENKRIAKQVFDNQLYLSKFGVQIPHDHLTKIFQYFEDIEIWEGFHSLVDFEMEDTLVLSMLETKGKEFRERLSKLIQIADIRIEEVYAKKDFKNTSRLYSKHKFFDKEKVLDYVDFDFQKKESKGTRMLIILGAYILNILDKGGILIFDELDNSLHSKLCKFLIRLFNNTVSNPYNAQLIFATHEVTLLDKVMFRKDQIWFTQKDKYGNTELYSAQDFEGVRENTNFELWYRTGKFGGNPKIKEVEFIFEHG